MEPMIVFVTAREGDLLKITGKEFEDYLKRAYQAGVEDGMRMLASKPTEPIIKKEMEITPYPYVGDPPGWWHDNIVYCSSADLPIAYTVKGE
jgi:hypothetical protein